MTKKSTKKVKAALKKMPMMKTSDGFMERLDEKITELDRPEWDQVDFDNEGNVYVGNGFWAKPRTWAVWTALLWIILSVPLWLGIWNEFNNNNTEYYLVPAPIENGEVAPDTFETPVDSTSMGELESIEEWFGDLPFIWEDNDLSFDQAFNLARSYLGPNDIFMWRGNKYNTLYAEEVVLYNN